MAEGPHHARWRLQTPRGHRPLPSRNETREGQKRKDKDRKRTKERREDQRGRKHSLKRVRSAIGATLDSGNQQGWCVLGGWRHGEPRPPVDLKRHGGEQPGKGGCGGADPQELAGPDAVNYRCLTLLPAHSLNSCWYLPIGEPHQSHKAGCPLVPTAPGTWRG